MADSPFEVWAQYGKGQPMLIKWPEEAKMQIVDDLKSHILSQLKARVDHQITNIELSKYGQQLSADTSVHTALHGCSFSNPIGVTEHVSRPKETMRTGQKSAREQDIQSHVAQRGLCSELLGLLYHKDFELKLNLPNSIIYCDGDFDRRVYTGPSRKSVGEVSQQKRYMDISEQKNKLLRCASVDPSGRDTWVAVLRFDDDNVRIVTAQALPRVLRSLKSSSNKNILLSRSDTGPVPLRPPRWQSVRSYIHPKNDLTYCCSYDKSKKTDRQRSSRKAWGARDVTRKASSTPTTEIIPYYFSERYRNYDTFPLVSNADTALYDQPAYDPDAGLVDDDVVPDTVSRECKRLIAGIVSFFEQVYGLELSYLACDFVQDTDGRLVLNDICAAHVEGNEDGGTVEGRSARTHEARSRLERHGKTARTRRPDKHEREISGRKKPAVFSNSSLQQEYDWIEQQTETDRERVDRLYKGSSSTNGKMKDWKQIATEHMQEVERLNKEALDNEKLWDNFLQKVIDANHKLETQKKHLKAENEALKRSVFQADHETAQSKRNSQRQTSSTQEIQAVENAISSMSMTDTHRGNVNTRNESQTIEVLHDTLARQRDELRKINRNFEEERRRCNELADLHDEAMSTLNDQKADNTANTQIRNELLQRIDSADRKILNSAKLVDLMRDYDPEGVEDMRRLLQEIDQVVAMEDTTIDRLLEDSDPDWRAKKLEMSEKIQNLFDNAVSLEQRRKRMRFEETAAFMWALKPGTTRKERAIMESLYTLDRSKHQPKLDGTSFDPSDPGQEKAHQLFSRLLESESGMGLLPTSKLNLPASYRRRLYDHSKHAAKTISKSKNLVGRR